MRSPNSIEVMGETAPSAEATALLREHCGICNGTCDGLFDSSLDHIWRVEVALLRGRSGWISVKDRLPEAGSYTLTYQTPQYPDDLGTPFGVDKYLGVIDVPTWQNDESQGVCADFWMPLPDSPVLERSTEDNS